MGAMNRWTRWDDTAQRAHGQDESRSLAREVKFNVALRDMNLGVHRADERRIEVLAQNLPCFGRAQLASHFVSDR